MSLLGGSFLWLRPKYICQCSNEYGSWEYPINDLSWCTSTPDETCTLDTETTETTYITLVEKPSDGVILAESSQYLTGATWDDVKLENSSHMQMRNDENMREALQNLFTDPIYGDFWNIPAR